MIYGIAAVLPRAINILLVKLHTGVLASERYAENTIYFVFAAYFNAVLTYGMETAFFRFFTQEKEKGRVISTAFISLLLTTGLGGCRIRRASFRSQAAEQPPAVPAGPAAAPSQTVQPALPEPEPEPAPPPRVTMAPPPQPELLFTNLNT